MVEGHQCHRVGHAHRRLLLGKAFEAASPNGRFAEGAAAITGKALNRIEVHGKNLFYFFAGSSSGSSGSAPGSNTAAAGTTPPPPPAAAGGPVVLSPEDEDPLAEACRQAAASADPAWLAAAAAAAALMRGTVVVHVHFGMSGAFRTSLLPGPDPTPTTRLRLVHSPTQLVAHLRRNDCPAWRAGAIRRKGA
ncbi:hypothetical protein COO60DRAFT_1643042 [Scenedesmus sp. NREL 46B-D3]|nr:hypothetical protein COO60DRAFT_1643042 [Scenedesmus sp. NREL 46B-D3]